MRRCAGCVALVVQPGGSPRATAVRGLPPWDSRRGAVLAPLTRLSDMSSAPFVRITELPAHAGRPVVVRAWVTHVRSSGKIAFAVLRDGTGVCQTVFVKNQLSPEVWERFSHLTTETSVAIEGEARAEARAPGGFEIGVTNLTIVGAAASITVSALLRRPTPMRT